MNDTGNVREEILDILQVCCGQFIQEKPGVTSICSIHRDEYNTY
jgi:hypothetical protein